MIEPGIYSDLDTDEYHASDGISSTGIKLILDCPARYKYEYDKRKNMCADEKTRQYDKYQMGRALHMSILEPNRFDNTFYCMSERVNLATKAGKSAYAKAEELANGRKILRAGEWEDVKAMASAALQNPTWQKIVSIPSKAEYSIYWRNETCNALLKSRPDLFNDAVIVDVKTTDCIKNFSHSIYNYGYHRQAAMQIDGVNSIDKRQLDRHFAFFVIEKTPPYLTAFFELDESSIRQGRKEYLDGALIYGDCLSAGVWPGYSQDFELISIPQWAKKEVHE